MVFLFLYRNGDAFTASLEKGPEGEGETEWTTESLNAERALFLPGPFHKCRATKVKGKRFFKGR